MNGELLPMEEPISGSLSTEQELKGDLDQTILYIDRYPTMNSYVGLVIISTVLDTEAKVINVYGGTSWIQHAGYFLRGAADNVSPDKSQSDGGEESVTLTSSQSGLPAHNHPTGTNGERFQTRPRDSSTPAEQGGTIAGTGYYYPKSTMPGWGSLANTGNSDAQDAAEPHNNMPPFKNVYIWERVA